MIFITHEQNWLNGSISNTFLFNILLCKLFIVVPNHDIVNYVEDNTSYLNRKNLQNVLLDLEQILDILLKQFTEKYLIENPEKYHVVVSTNIECSLKLQDFLKK